MDQDGTWHGGGLGPGHIVLDGDPAPLPKKGAEPLSPILGPFLLYSQTVGCIKMPLGMEVGLSPDDFVLDGDPALNPNQFSAHICCGDTAAWIKMPLGVTEVGLGLCDIVFDVHPATPRKRGTPTSTQF